MTAEEAEAAVRERPFLVRFCAGCLAIEIARFCG
jgi:hypothetical protein